jgi:hypothetical protein
MKNFLKKSSLFFALVIGSSAISAADRFNPDGVDCLKRIIEWHIKETGPIYLESPFEELGIPAVWVTLNPQEKQRLLFGSDNSLLKVFIDGFANEYLLQLLKYLELHDTEFVSNNVQGFEDALKYAEKIQADIANGEFHPCPGYEYQCLDRLRKDCLLELFISSFEGMKCIKEKKQAEFAAAEMRAAKITAATWVAAAAVAVFAFKQGWPQRVVQAARRPVAVALTVAAGLLTSLAQKVAKEAVPALA